MPHPHDITAAAYLRVSTGGQHPDAQRDSCERLCRFRGWHPKVFIETASATGPRPVWDLLLSEVRRGEHAAVVVWALDRLGRSMAGNVATVLELDRLGVPVVSVCEGWLDIGGPTRPLLLAVFSWIAEQEKVRLGERTRAGLERARSRGAVLGRPRKSIPLAAAEQMLRGGHSVRRIAHVFGVAPSTMARALSRKRGSAGTP